MISFIKELWMLKSLELPHGFSRKRIILNFAILYIRSFGSQKLLDESKLNHYDVKIESKIWQSFEKIISLYIKYLAPKYLMKTYVIQRVATGWHSKSYIDFLEENFKEEHQNKISKPIRITIENCVRILTSSFSGISFPVVYRWLQTYQYGFNEFIDDPKKVSDKLENMLIVELGAGLGVNACVHATLSKKGVCIFDLPPMLKIQKIVADKVGKKMNLSPISYFSTTEEIINATKGKPYIVVSYWAFTEFPESLRNKVEPLLKNAEIALFASNSFFEGVDNKKYFERLNKRLSGKSFEFKTISWNPYKKHFYVWMQNLKK